MRKSNLTPSIVPDGNSRPIVSGRRRFRQKRPRSGLRRTWRRPTWKRSFRTCLPASTTTQSASSPSTRPNGGLRRSCPQMSHELRNRCDLQVRDVPFYLQDFTDRYEGRYRDVQLPLPMRLV